MRLTDRILRFFHNYWLIIAITALVKVAIAGTVIFLQPLPSGFFESFSHWDGYRYISIAKNWYAIENGREIVWFPFYPFLIRLVSYATSDYFLSGVLISVFFSLTASILLFELTRLDFDRRTALTAVWFLNIFPTAYFLQSSYTESLFLTLSIGTIYCFRNKLFARSALLGALATATRPNGVMLIPVLFMEAMAFANTNVKTERDHWFKTLATLSFISLGLLGYLAINYFGFGTPFYFLKIQSTFQSQNITWPWVGIQGLLATLHHAKESYGFAEFAAIAFGGVSIPYLLFKVRKSYALYVLLNWLLMASSTFILSRPRYLLILFPIYMMLGKIRNKWILILISLIFLVLHFHYGLLFTQHEWAF